jgi:hypothetical protein
LIYQSQFLAKLVSLALSLCLLLAGPQVFAGSFFDQFMDKHDGWFDASDWVLDNAHGFMPVPIIITEPAVGEGLGAALLFFHAPEDYSKEKFENSGKYPGKELPVLDSSGETGPDTDGKEEFVRPNISAVAAAATNNGTWFTGGGHFARWKDDTIDYKGVVGYASVNLTFYGQPGSPINNSGFDFNGEGLFFDQNISWRLQDSNFFLGPSYTFLEVDASFDLGQILPGLPGVDKTTQQSGIGIFLSYDSRDSIFTPSTGAEAEISATVNDESIGSDFNYNRYEAYLHKWWEPFQKWVLGLRLDGQYVDGSLPFYSVPYIDLRGIPAMRYQGRAVAVGEVEVRWNFHPRISGIGFTGIGKAADKASNFDMVPSRSTVGAGIRYKVARKLGMYAGIDVARGPEDTYWYIVMGTAW